MSRRLSVAVTLSSVVVALFLPVASVTSAAPTPAAAARAVVLRSAVPQQVRSGHARALGRVALTSRINLAITLKMRNPAQLRATLAAIGSPTSPSYRHYLSQAQANRRFNPTVPQEKAVSGWLKANGLTVTRTFANHLVVDARGTAARVDRAFGVSLTRYAGLINGLRATFYAPSTAPRVPATVGGLVSEVLGLNNTLRMQTDAQIAKRFARPAGVRRHGYGAGVYYPSDFQAAYDVNSVVAAAGSYLSQQRIGIVMWCDPPSNTLLGAWAAAVGSRAPTVVLHDFSFGQSGEGDQIESDLDVEYSSGVSSSSSQGAVIDYYQTESDASCSSGSAGGSGGPILNALNAAATTKGATMDQQISGSFGGCGSGDFDAPLKSGSLTGHNFLFSSGDSGSHCGSNTAAQEPADSLYATGVGGTGFNNCSALGPNPITSYPGEVAWCYAEVTATEGSGGGFDSVYGTTPSWQGNIQSAWGQGFSCIENGTCRGVPDVAGPADPRQSGAFVCADTGYCYQIGGTSEASPMWAGFLADINADFAAQGLASGVGPATQALYSLAYNPATYGRDFHDITSGTNGAYNAGTGWDPVTGLGSPDVANLEADWYDLSTTLTVTVSTSGTYGGTPDISLAPNDSDITYSPSSQAANVTGTLTCDTNATSSSHVVGNPYTISDCSGLDDAGYSIQYDYADSSYTVNPLPLTITAMNQAATYRSHMPSFTWSGNFVNGDSATSLSTQPTCTTTATQDLSGDDTSPVGGYDINCSGAAGSDYSPITYAVGTLMVNQAAPNLTWAKPADITYGAPLGHTQLDASSNGTPGLFSYNPPATTVLGAGENQALSATFTPTDQADYVSGGMVTSSITVKTAPLTITATNQAVTYGSKMPALTWSANFVNGDAAASLSSKPTCTTAATADSHGNDISSPGTYNITCTGAAGANYGPITYARATLTVSKAPVVLTYTGPKTIRVGATVMLSSKMMSVAAVPIGGKPITFDLFPLRGPGQQMCHATTNHAGTAACTITNVHNFTKTRWVRMVFAGNEDYVANTTTAIVTVNS